MFLKTFLNGICHNSLRNQTCIDVDQVRASYQELQCKEKKENNKANCITPLGNEVGPGSITKFPVYCRDSSSEKCSGDIGCISF